MKKNSNRQSNNVKNSLNKDSKSFSLDENDDHSFELK